MTEILEQAVGGEVSKKTKVETKLETWLESQDGKDYLARTPSFQNTIDEIDGSLIKKTLRHNSEMNSKLSVVSFYLRGS